VVVDLHLLLRTKPNVGGIPLNGRECGLTKLDCCMKFFQVAPLGLPYQTCTQRFNCVKSSSATLVLGIRDN